MSEIMERCLTETIKAYGGSYGIVKQNETRLGYISKAKYVEDAFKVAGVLMLVPYYNSLVGKVKPEVLKESFEEFYDGLMRGYNSFGKVKSEDRFSEEARDYLDDLFGKSRKVLKMMHYTDAEIKRILDM